MRILRSKQNFSGGEWSPRLYSRTNLEKYSSACKTVTNAIVVAHGPVKRRNGSEFIAEVKDSTKQVRLVKFQFSADDAFILEFGEYYIRFYTAKAPVLDSGVPVELVSPWSETEIQSLQFAQYGDTLYIVHPDFVPRTLIRESSINWTLEALDVYPGPSEELGYKPAGTVTPAATTGSGIDFTSSDSIFLAGDIGRQITNLNGTGRAAITAITSSAVAVATIVEDFPSTSAIISGDWKLDLSPVADLTPTGTAAGSIITFDADLPSSASSSASFRNADVGKYILIHNGVCRIVSITSDTACKAEVIKSLDSKDETGNWTMEELTWSSTRGYPRAVGFHGQRLVFGGNTAEPQSIWLSEAGVFDSFGVGTNDSDSVDVDISSSAVNRIEWIASTRDLIIGTSGAESTVSANSGTITPSDISQRPRSYNGSNTQQPVAIGSEILYVQKSGKRIYSFLFNFDIDSYDSDDLTFFAEHLTADEEIREMVVALQPERVIYAVLESGAMLAGVYHRQQAVLGWSKLTTDGLYEQVNTISENGEDQVWVVVKRTIDGNTVRYIEVFDNGNGDSNTDGFSDSYLTYSGGATTTFTGLDHLEGEVVQVKVNGASHPDRTVSGGSISLAVSATTATVGLPYTTTIETLDEDLNTGQGPMIGQDVSWVEPILRVHNSTIPEVNGQAKPRRTPDMSMDTKVSLFTGILKYGRVDSPRLQITTTDPYPLMVTGIFGTVEGDA